jgi:hypothetical protein
MKKAVGFYPTAFLFYTWLNDNINA